jgi:hypothetical protein
MAATTTAVVPQVRTVAKYAIVSYCITAVFVVIKKMPTKQLQRLRVEAGWRWCVPADLRKVKNS